MCKVKARSNVEGCETCTSTSDESFQEDDVVIIITEDDDIIPVEYARGGMICQGTKMGVSEARRWAHPVDVLMRHHQVLLVDEGFVFIDALMDHEKIVSTCKTIFKRIENPTGFSWKLTPDNIKAKYFDEFRKYFAWPPKWETEVYQVWEAKACVRYFGWLNDMKKKRNNGKPLWINLETWNGLCSYWDTPEVIDRSTKARQNRMSEPDGPGTGISKHRSGSRPIRRLVEEMATEKGISHTQCVYETFHSIHVKKDRTYLTPKDAKIDDRVNDLVS
ncbi:hypothetical protein C2S51_029855 [Perilla frutescens var. frutescens]|nr:hypothetical protein C2S51_029855 [Perilla frutescens var. frutescens]